MAVIELIIKIDEEEYKSIKKHPHWHSLGELIAHGTPLPTGHWIKEKALHCWDGKSYQCSVCGRSIHIDSEVENLSDYHYCHCGAKMAESVDKNEKM